MEAYWTQQCPGKTFKDATQEFASSDDDDYTSADNVALDGNGNVIGLRRTRPRAEPGNTILAMRLGARKSGSVGLLGIYGTMSGLASSPTCAATDRDGRAGMLH